LKLCGYPSNGSGFLDYQHRICLGHIGKQATQKTSRNNAVCFKKCVADPDSTDDTELTSWRFLAENGEAH
jgi:hypothetical protein